MALETNIPDEKIELIRAHYELQNGIFFSEVHEQDGLISATSRASSAPMWNHSTSLNGKLGIDHFDRATAFHQDRGRLPVLYDLDLESSPLKSASSLEKAGWDKFDRETWMVFKGQAFKEQRSELQFGCAADSAALQRFILAFHASYRLQESGYASALETTAATSGAIQQHFTLLKEDETVSVLTLVRKGDCACIYNVGTPPAFRQKGYAAELLKRTINRALDGGCVKLFLQAESGGNAERLYKKLGFESSFFRNGYRLRDWKRPEVEHQWTSLVSALGRASKRTDQQPGRLRESFHIPAELIDRVERLAAARGTGTENLLAANWAALLYRYTAQARIAFEFENAAQQAGLLSFDLEPNLPISSLVEQFQKQSGRLSPASNLSRAEIIFRAAPSMPKTGATNSEYPLEAVVRGKRLDTVELFFRSDSFRKENMRRFGSHFLNLLGNFCENPETPTSRIELLSPRERRQLLIEWNQPGFERTAFLLARLFEDQVERTPDAMAARLAGAGSPAPSEQLTYRELNRKANRLAHQLRKLGVGPEKMVGVCLDRSLDLLVSLIGIFKAGGVCVPLDPAYPPDRLGFILQDTAAPIVLTHSKLLSGLPKTNGVMTFCLDREEGWLKEDESNPASVVSLENAAYVIYTSGSTGQPKGVVVTHGAIANHSIDCKRHYGLGPKDNVLQFSSFNFDASFEQILPALISGSCLVLRDNEIWSISEFGEKLRDFGLTVTDLPTAYWHQLVEEWHANPSSAQAHRLRLMIVGGEAIAPAKLLLWRQSAFEKIRLINAYGPTETTITATSFELPSGDDRDSDVVAIGRPRADRTAYILDPNGEATPIGVAGELHIGGSLLARGYHNRPELTAARFVPDPFSRQPLSRLYRTGDLARYLEDGNIEFLGRLDDQVKIRGFRIELGEIEAALREHPAVRDALLLAKASEGGEKRLAAYVVPSGNAPEPGALRRFLKTKLPDYMVPAVIVCLKTWPLMPNGKIDRRALPEPSNESGENAIESPRDSLELQLQLIFERVLKRAPIGVDVSFFELGGDSLQALEVLVEIERSTGKSLPMGTLYQSSTVEGLALEVRQLVPESTRSSLAPLQTNGTRPPLFLIHTTPGDVLGYGNLVYRLGSEQPCYGLQSLGLLDATRKHTTIEEMAEFYVRQIRISQPHGPYRLAGWCYGGIVAVEMGRLLRQAGEKVAFLGLLETVAMPPSILNFRYYFHRIECFFGMNPAQWMTYSREKLRYIRSSRLANRMRFRQVDDTNRVSKNGEILDPRLALLEQIYNANLAALNRFRSKPYDGKLALFNAAERDPALIPDSNYGWKHLAREIEIHYVPGNHDTMLTEPNVAVLAREIEQCLAKSEENLFTPK